MDTGSLEEQCEGSKEAAGVTVVPCSLPEGMGQYSHSLLLAETAAAVLGQGIPEEIDRRLASGNCLVGVGISQVLFVMSCHRSVGREDLVFAGSPKNHFEVVPVLSVALQR